jgi:hypothetical protein
LAVDRRVQLDPVGHGSRPLWPASAAFPGGCVGALSAVAILSGVRVFAWMIPVVVWLSLFSTPMPAMMDGTTFRLLKDHPERYGRYRMWGTVGFILTSLAGGFLFERIGVAAVFPAYGLTIFFFSAILLRPAQYTYPLQTSPFDGIGRLVRQPAWLLFAISVFILWIASTGSISFVGVLVKALGGSERLIGFNWAVAAVVELPVMWSSAMLLKRLGLELADYHRLHWLFSAHPVLRSGSSAGMGCGGERLARFFVCPVPDRFGRLRQPACATRAESHFAGTSFFGDEPGQRDRGVAQWLAVRLSWPVRPVPQPGVCGSFRLHRVYQRAARAALAGEREVMVEYENKMRRSN